MEAEVEKIINETHLIVLKKKSNSNSVTIDYVEIINTIRKELDYLYEISENDKYPLKDFEKIISNNDHFKKMLGYMNFCKFLSSPYQGIGNSVIDYASFFQVSNSNEKGLSINERLKLESEKKKQLSAEFKIRDLPYALEEAYEKCNNDKEILAYSHRRTGWAMRKYLLVNNFSVRFLTNFGFGSASYFFTKLTYKKIDIIPFSDWIIYKKANLHQIIRYSAVHNVKNESWLDAMEYAKSAIDLFNSSERGFINKYILNKCKCMVEGLEDILTKHIFSFKKYTGKYDDFEYTDKRLLIAFRGEKISGALKFISSIIKFKNIIEVQDFVKTIIKFNRIIHPILKSELNAVCAELKEVHNNFDIIIGKITPIYYEYKFLSELKDRLKKVVNSKEKDFADDKKTNTDLCFEERYPNYINMKDDFDKLEWEYIKLRALIDQLEGLEYKFNSYISEIDLFFKENNIMIKN
jgi:hypothetical protein